MVCTLPPPVDLRSPWAELAEMSARLTTEGELRSKEAGEELAAQDPVETPVQGLCSLQAAS